MNGKDIKIPLYDRLDVTFNPTKDGKEYTLDDGDTFFFIIKAKAGGDVIKRITQTSKAFSFDYVDFDEGVYKYEFGIRFADGTKKTIIPNEQDGEVHPRFIVGDALEGKTDGD